MDEFDTIMEKYGDRPLREHFGSLDEINQFAVQFYQDAAEIYDCFTRVKNFDRNPSGYSLEDAPIIGLLVRIWKLLKETIRYHIENNAEFIAIFQRNDSMDWCLQRNEDGTFSIHPFFHPADIRYITPLLPFCSEPYALWLKRIGADDRHYTMFLDWIAKQNWNLYLEFNRLYGDIELA